MNMLAISKIKSDLLWLTEGSELLCGPRFRLFQELYSIPRKGIQRKISALNGSEDELGDLLNKEHRKLGIYFEELVSCYLKLNGLEVMQQNVSLLDKRRTVGEVDMVVREGTLTMALELAVKFYLWDPYSAKFCSPNGSDRFEDKYQRIQEGQIPRAEEHVKAITTSGRVGAWVLGRLYYPLFQKELPDHLPLCRDTQRGVWWKWKESGPFPLGQGGRIRLSADRFDWMSGPESGTPTMTSIELNDQLSNYFSTSRGSVEGEWTGPEGELIRFFIVHPSWPFS